MTILARVELSRALGLPPGCDFAAYLVLSPPVASDDWFGVVEGPSALCFQVEERDGGVPVDDAVGFAAAVVGVFGDVQLNHRLTVKRA